MSETWRSGEAPHEGPIPPAGWLRVVLKGVPMAVVTFGCLALLLLLRLVERPFFGARRPVTPHITRFVCRTNLAILGLKLRVEGKPLAGGGAQVANHSSWLDIFVLNAPQTVYFVSKAEVAGWPGIGWLARATGTVFIRRSRAEAREQVALFEERLAQGHKLLFFPEGTSTDGLRVLPFKSTLFAAFFSDALRDTALIQPVSLRYIAPDGEDARLYGWWGDMDFGPHLIRTLAARRQGEVRVTFHSPLKVAEARDRKDLALRLEEAVRGPFVAAGLTERD